MIFSASASAKVILFGEHAVVYGIPALAVPVSDLRSYVSLSYSVSSGLFLSDLFVSCDVMASVNPYAGLVRSFFYEYGESSLALTVFSDIPVSSGLGSGASVSVSILRALYQAYSISFDYTKGIDLIYQTECAFHGNPSGIDHTVIVYERPVYFVRNRLSESLSITGEYHLLIGNTGFSASTKESVASVKSLYEDNPKEIRKLLIQIHNIVDAAKTALSHADQRQLGNLMNRNHQLLQLLTVSSPALDKLVNAARDAGAYGAKLSGGGRGGNMIALVSESHIEQVRDAILDAGATAVYHTILK